MKLKNIIVIFTVIIPEIEVDKELGIVVARDKIRCVAKHRAFKTGDVEVSIKDCSDYPALCD